MFHEGIIINIPALSKKRRDELEILLSIFDQDNRSENHHIMNVKESDIPEKFRPIIRRLQGAILEPEMRDYMTVEDDFYAEINDIENRMANALEGQMEERRLKEEAIQKQEEAIQNQQEAIKKQDEALKKQDEALKKQDEAIKLLLKFGVSEQEIAQQLSIAVDYIIALKNK